jgi:hypothetical protein
MLFPLVDVLKAVQKEWRMFSDTVREVPGITHTLLYELA